jgi:transposase
MAAPRKYPEESRERAIKMAVELRRDPASRSGALRRVGDQLGISPETLRNLVQQAEIDAGRTGGHTTSTEPSEWSRASARRLDSNEQRSVAAPSALSG